MRWARLVALCLWAIPAQARWLEAETPHFIVYSDGAEPKLREFALLLEDYDGLLRVLSGTKAQAPSKLRSICFAALRRFARYATCRTRWRACMSQPRGE